MLLSQAIRNALSSGSYSGFTGEGYASDKFPFMCHAIRQYYKDSDDYVAARKVIHAYLVKKGLPECDNTLSSLFRDKYPNQSAYAAAGKSEFLRAKAVKFWNKFADKLEARGE